MNQKTLALLLCSSSLVALSVGCELVVDFDRTKIAQPIVDASTADVIVQPTNDAGPGDAANPSDAASSDASSDAALDAGSDAEVDASDGG
jgi:hypothetical protein